MQEERGSEIMSKDQAPPSVPIVATQGGQAAHRKIAADPSVWTDSMLRALDEGVRGGVWFSLIDKVWTDRNLRSSFGKVSSNGGAPGVDRISVEEFEQHLEGNLKDMSEALRGGSYKPQLIRRVTIPKPGSDDGRPPGIPTVRDRVVQGAVRHVIEPIFEREFALRSYGFRPGLGCKDALRRVDELVKGGFEYVVDADLKNFFDTIPHDRLMGRMGERIADGRLPSLIESFPKAGIMDGTREWSPETGAPQGAVLSPLLSNIYLNPLDHLMAKRGWEMVRYADDFAILCRSQSEAEQALAFVVQWCEAEGLSLHPEKTRIVEVRKAGFDFLGYHFQGTSRGRLTRWPRKKSLGKVKDAVRAKTKRTAGKSLGCIIGELNRTLRGWFEYYKHSCAGSFANLDGWIRMRLRSLLRRRRGRQGRSRRSDQEAWPNAYFAERGLFDLKKAQALASQSPPG